MISVRRCRREDQPSVARLFRELSRFHRDLYRIRSKGGRDRWFRTHLKEHGMRSLWVAEERGRLIGVAGLVAHQRSGEIDPIVVAHAWRRRGVSRLIIEALRKEANRRRWTTLTVQVTARNAVAVRAFHALGFRTIVNLDLSMPLEGTGPFVSRPGPSIAGRRFRS